MLSRVADSLFWFGRYLERAENYARFIDVNNNLSLDLPPGMEEQWEPLIAATGDLELYLGIYHKVNKANAIRFLAFDEKNQNSIISSVTKARENARIVRENITNEIWEAINELYQLVITLNRKAVWKKEDSREYFKKIKNQIELIFGILECTVPRTQGWYFTQIGQFLERADKTSRILDVKYHILLPSPDEIGSPLDFLHWAALLKSVSAYNAYRKLNGKVIPSKVVEYLVLNRYFPRSILFCLIRVEEHLKQISDHKGRGYSNKVEKEIGNLLSDMEYSDITDVFEFGLHEYLDKFQIRLNEISLGIHEEYFKIQPNFAQQIQEQS